MVQSSNLSVYFSIEMRGQSVHRLTLLGQRLHDTQAIILQLNDALVLLDAKENPIQHRTPFRMRTVLVLKIGLEQAVFLALRCL